jgi:hypothetical protein
LLLCEKYFFAFLPNECDHITSHLQFSFSESCGEKLLFGDRWFITEVITQCLTSESKKTERLTFEGRRRGPYFVHRVHEMTIGFTVEIAIAFVEQ